MKKTDTRQVAYLLCGAFLFLLAIYLRCSGLFRGLADNVVFHPDEPKQIQALAGYLHGVYVRYHGSLFYDGYPYGLNHLDEYLLRPLLLLFGERIPSKDVLFYLVHALRCVYSITAICATLYVAKVLKVQKGGRLVLLLFLALSPLLVTVAHFGTGDVGIDLFSSLVFLTLAISLERRASWLWILLSGFFVGAAFAAKYQGLLVGLVPFLFILVNGQSWKRRLGAYLLLGLGVVAGILIFLPHICIDFRKSIDLILANFAFIKNYNVPREIQELSWFNKMVAGFVKNTFRVLSVSGLAFSVATVLTTLWAGRKVYCIPVEQRLERQRFALILGIGLYVVLTFIASLAGKYMVQPFHFSSLQIPMALLGTIFAFLLLPQFPYIGRCITLLFIIIAGVEAGRVSLIDNFFWRHQDTMLYAKGFARTVYSVPLSGKIPGIDSVRSVALEPGGNYSIFRNRYKSVAGFDAAFWTQTGVAPVPQLTNPFGKDWIFLDGPSFPRNERMIFVHGGSRGETMKRILVTADANRLFALGVRSGSYPVSMMLSLGGKEYPVSLPAHSQTIIPLHNAILKPLPLVSGKGVLFYSLAAQIKQNDAWVTFLPTSKDLENYRLFGPDPVTNRSTLTGDTLQLQRGDVEKLKKMRYWSATWGWSPDSSGKAMLFEEGLPAGRYSLECEVEAGDDSVLLGFDFIDAAAGAVSDRSPQFFRLQKGHQVITYHFMKKFAPYQIHFTAQGKTSRNWKIRAIRLTPDYEALRRDFEEWQRSGVVPAWKTDGDK